METKDLLSEIAKFDEKIPPESPNNPQMQVIADMYNVAKTQTKNFTDVNAISNSEVDVRAILQRENVDPAKWVKEKDSFKRSEKQSLLWLFDELKRRFTQSANSVKMKALAMMKMKAAAKIKLAQA